MDNSAQKTQSPSLVTPAPAPSQQPPQQQAVQPMPVSGIQKELQVGPISQPTTETLIKPTETEPMLTPEVSEIGVEAHDHETIRLTEEQKKAGILPAKEATPVPTEPSGMVHLPMAPQQAHIILQTHKKISDSIVWLALLVLKQVKMMHQKMTGGENNVGT